MTKNVSRKDIFKGEKPLQPRTMIHTYFCMSENCLGDQERLLAKKFFDFFWSGFFVFAIIIVVVIVVSSNSSSIGSTSNSSTNGSTLTLSSARALKLRMDDCFG
jgi:hypothetical protein